MTLDSSHTPDSISLALPLLPMSFDQFQAQEDGSSGLEIMPNSMAYGASNSGMEMQGVPGCMRLVEGIWTG